MMPRDNSYYSSNVQHVISKFFHYLSLCLIFCFSIYLTGCSSFNRPIKVCECPYLIKRLQCHTCAIHNGQIEYYTFGEGSPIVLIPGFASDVSSWDREFLLELSKHHQLIIMNNRNIGRSYVTSHHFRAEDFAQDTYELVEGLHLCKPTILGISMGGMIAQKYAIMYPDHLSHLVLMNTGPSGKWLVRPNAEVRQKLLTLKDDKVERYVTAIKVFFPDNWKPNMAYRLLVERFQPSGYVEVKLKNIMPQQKQLLMHWLQDNMTTVRLKEIKVPVLIITGDRDIVVPPINSVTLYNHLPHARLICWKDAGHAITFQYPRQSACLISNFIADPVL